MAEKYLHKRTQTKRQLTKATFKLAQKMGLKNVTVSAIIDEVHVNRSTFYRHFQDKWDLVEQIEQKILNTIRKDHDAFLETSNLEDTNARKQYLWEALTFIDDNQHLIKIFLSDEGDYRFRDSLKKMFLEMIKATIDSTLKVSDSKAKLLANYLASAILGTIKMWGENYGNYTKEEIFDFLNEVDPNLLGFEHK